jgi:hypothetical protein
MQQSFSVQFDKQELLLGEVLELCGSQRHFKQSGNFH